MQDTSRHQKGVQSQSAASSTQMYQENGQCQGLDPPLMVVLEGEFSQARTTRLPWRRARACSGVRPVAAMSPVLMLCSMGRRPLWYAMSMACSFEQQPLAYVQAISPAPDSKSMSNHCK